MHYFGESSRNAYLRGSEHLRALRNKNKSSVLFKHIMTEHREEQGDVKFQMKVAGKFSSALSRQIFESRNIRNTKPENLMNSKSEFYGPCLKRKVFTDY